MEGHETIMMEELDVISHGDKASVEQQGIHTTRISMNRITIIIIEKTTVFSSPIKLYNSHHGD